MPESANPPLSDADLQALAARLNYAINVFPQPSRISIGSGEVVEVDGAWQWSVRYRGGNRATGHSCGSPELAFDRALSTLRELLHETPVNDNAIGGGFTGASLRRETRRLADTVHYGRENAPSTGLEWLNLLRATPLWGDTQTAHETTYAETSREF